MQVIGLGRLPSTDLSCRFCCYTQHRGDGHDRLIMSEQVGVVTFRRPKTGQDFSSGFQADLSDLQSVPKGATITLWCTSCGQKHEFKMSEGRITERPGAGTR